MFSPRTLSVSLIATALLATAPALAAERNYDFDTFNSVKVSTGIDVEIHQGEMQSVRVEARTNILLDKLTLEVRDGELVAESDYGFWDFVMDGGLVGAVFSANSKPDIKVILTTTGVERLDASSGSDIIATGLSGQVLEVNVSSGADARISKAVFQSYAISTSSGADAKVDGTCTSAILNASSGSDINAKALQCDTVEIDVSSGSDTNFYATKSAHGHVSSGGDATVYGAPANIKIETSSGGDVHYND